MANIFTSAQMPKVSVNRFDLSHDVKMSFDMGELVPVLNLEALPGDIFNIRPETLLRFAPLVSPVMHNIIVDTHYFFVPNRIMWVDWEGFITGENEYAVPYISNLSTISDGDLADYFQIPYSQHAGLQVTAWPAACYSMIYDEFYRDQNLQAEVTPASKLNAGNNVWARTLLDGPPLKRAWNHDYFTSCLPFAQKGDAVTLPLLANGTAPVTLTDPYVDPTAGKFFEDDGTTVVTGAVNAGGAGTNTLVIGATNLPSVYDPNGSLEVDLNAEANDITTIRRAFRLQEFLEKDARGGTRYIESVYAHFGVKSSDARFQRPEYIGGSKQQMVISEVLSATETLNSSDVVVNPVGQMAGHGISVGGGNNTKFRVEEHGWIVGIISVRPRTAYQEGIPRKYSRTDRLDYAWPTFANIGEQPVYLKELYAKPVTSAELDDVFGYIPRYSEYKYHNSWVAGDMKTTLDFWHLGRQFASTPALNSNFIECDPDKRIFAVPSEHGIYAHIINNISVIRKLPRFSTPSI